MNKFENQKSEYSEGTKRSKIEIKTVNERDSTRIKYNGLKELLISWNKQ